MRLQSNTAYRMAAGLALTAAFLIVWLNAAAGLIGIEDDDPANLLYVGVLAIGFIGAIVARFQPRGLARTSFATALPLQVTFSGTPDTIGNASSVRTEALTGAPASTASTPASASPVRRAASPSSRYRPRPAWVSRAKQGAGLAASASHSASSTVCLSTSAWLPAWKTWR